MDASNQDASSKAAPNDVSLIAIGRLVGTHGIRGELKLRPFNPDSQAIFPGIEVTLKKAGAAQVHVITSVRPHKRLLLVVIEGCGSMSDAEALVGSDVCIDESALPAAGPNEMYHYQLIGLEVVTVDGTVLGKVVDIIETAANDVCTVRGRGREYLIPLIEEVVKSVDKDARRLVIDPLPGLLDL